MVGFLTERRIKALSCSLSPDAFLQEALISLAQSHSLADVERALELSAQALEVALVQPGDPVDGIGYDIVPSADRVEVVLRCPGHLGDEASLRIFVQLFTDALVGEADLPRSVISQAEAAEVLNDFEHGLGDAAGRQHWTSLAELCRQDVQAAQAETPTTDERRLPGAGQRLDKIAPGDRAEAFCAAVWAAVIAYRGTSPSPVVALRSPCRDYDELDLLFAPLEKYLPIQVPEALAQPARVAEATRRSLDQARRWADYYEGPAPRDQGAGPGVLPYAFQWRAPLNATARDDESDVRVLDISGATDLFGMRLDCRPEGADLVVRLHWQEIAASAQVAGFFLDGFEQMLTAALDDPERPLALAAALDRAEREALTEFEHGSRHAIAARSVAERILDVAGHPDAIAVIDTDGQHTFGHVAARANALAAHLLGDGAGKDRPVAVLCRPGADLVAAVLGVLRSGAPLVLLDEDWPLARRESLVAQVGASHIVTAGSAFGLAGRVVDLPALQGSGVLPQAMATSPDDVAYIQFTSGTTGHPRAVTVTQSALSNRLDWAQRTYPLGPQDRVLQVASPGFDFALWEILAPLLAGACAVIASPETRQDPARIAALIEAQGVTVAHFVPTVFGLLLQQDWTPRPPLRLLLSGGEALPPDVANRLLASDGGVALYNQYGPTECTIDVTSAPLAAADLTAGVPIGKPIANTRVHLLDAALNRVPIGATGALYVAGDSLALGYWGDSGETADRFIPDPFTDEPGQRLYRTGDLGFWRADGQLAFAGRSDDQIKIAGQRLEPIEVEQTLRAHPSVANAAVLLDLDGHTPRLVAFVVAAAPMPEPTDLTQDVQRWVSEWLPTFMIPARILSLDAIPTTTTGKVDRASLLALARGFGGRADGSPAAATDPIEIDISQIVTRQLNLATLSSDDDLFALGLTSIDCIHIVAGLRGKGYEVDLMLLYQSKSISSLAKALHAAKEAGGVT